MFRLKLDGGRIGFITTSSWSIIGPSTTLGTSAGSPFVGVGLGVGASEDRGGVRGLGVGVGIEAGVVGIEREEKGDGGGMIGGGTALVGGNGFGRGSTRLTTGRDADGVLEAIGFGIVAPDEGSGGTGIAGILACPPGLPSESLEGEGTGGGPLDPPTGGGGGVGGALGRLMSPNATGAGSGISCAWSFGAYALSMSVLRGPHILLFKEVAMAWAA